MIFFSQRRRGAEQSRRDSTLLTVGFNLRNKTTHTTKSHRDDTSHRKVSSLRDLSERLPCRRLKPTVNKVLSLRDCFVPLCEIIRSKGKGGAY